MFLSRITSHFRDLRISVEIDPRLLVHLDCDDKESTQRPVSINLYKLIYYMGTIQTRRFAPSNRQKFTDKADLVEKIYRDTDEFRIKINEIRDGLGAEKLGDISEDFGVGISVIIAMNLFNIKLSTVERISGNDKRPDWTCQTTNDRILVVESKGSVTQAVSNNQTANALNQKRRRPGDVHIASLTLLAEDQISSNRFLDPPGDITDMDSERQNRILKAGHYSSVFSFLGDSALSRYFTQMRKRLSNEITPEEQILKDNSYREIRDKYDKVTFYNRVYAGTFYSLDDDEYLFLGVDRNLISYKGFIHFSDYKNDVDDTFARNHYILYKDGILIIEIKNIRAFPNLQSERIRNYQEFNTISDVDAMTEISFRKYIMYVLKQIGFDIISESNSKNENIDIIGFYRDKRYLFELKLVDDKRINPNEFEQLRKTSTEVYRDHFVLITNAFTDNINILVPQNVTIIGRRKLRQVLKNKDILLELLSNRGE